VCFCPLGPTTRRRASSCPHRPRHISQAAVVDTHCMVLGGGRFEAALDAFSRRPAPVLVATWPCRPNLLATVMITVAATGAVPLLCHTPRPAPHWELGPSLWDYLVLGLRSTWGGRPAGACGAVSGYDGAYHAKNSPVSSCEGAFRLARTGPAMPLLPSTWSVRGQRPDIPRSWYYPAPTPIRLTFGGMQRAFGVSECSGERPNP
jgi:hypothetical protein